MNEWVGAGLPAAGRRRGHPPQWDCQGERTSTASVQHHRHSWDPLLKCGWIDTHLWKDSLKGKSSKRKGRKGLKFRSTTDGIGRAVFTETLNLQLLTPLSSQQLLSSLSDGPTHVTAVSSSSLKRCRKPKRHLVFTEEFIPSTAHLRPIDSPSWIRKMQPCGSCKTSKN